MKQPIPIMSTRTRRNRLQVAPFAQRHPFISIGLIAAGAVASALLFAYGTCLIGGAK